MLLVVLLLLLPVLLLRRRRCNRLGRRLDARKTTADRAAERCAGDPVVAEGFDVRAASVNLSLLRSEQLKDAYLHRVVLKLGMLDDPMPQGQDDAVVVVRSFTCGQQGGRGAPDLGADLHRVRVVPLL